MNSSRTKRSRFKLRNRKKNKTSHKFPAVVSALTTMGLGVVYSWTSPALPHLTSSTSSFPISEIQASWIASLLGWGIIFGHIINPLIINRLGSKRTLLFLVLPQILSWIMIYFGRNWLLVCFARVFGGVGYGAGQCSTAIYLSEIGDKQNRGIFLTLIKLSINIGIFVTMFFGDFLSYDAMNLALLIIPIVFGLAFYSAPDTRGFGVDYFDDGVRKSLAKVDLDGVEEEEINVMEGDVLRKDSDCSRQYPNNLADNSNNLDHHPNVLSEGADGLKQYPNESEDTSNCLDHQQTPFENGTNEITTKWRGEKAETEALIENTINKNIKKEEIEQDLNLLQRGSSCLSEKKSSTSVWWKLFILQNNRNSLLIMTVVTLTDIFSGHMTIISYTQQIFEYSGASLKPEYAALILAFLKIGASLISALVVEKFGRRKLFLSTGIFAGLSQGTVALFFFLKLYLEMDVSSIRWLPLFGVSMYEIVGSVGFSSLFYVYQGELFSDDVKSLGVTFTNVSYEFITFFLKLYFQIVIDAIGIYSVFFGFGICCFIGSCLVYCISPETKGKSKKEIRKLLS